jgi:hypothetical protein
MNRSSAYRACSQDLNRRRQFAQSAFLIAVDAESLKDGDDGFG